MWIFYDIIGYGCNIRGFASPFRLPNDEEDL